MLKGEQVCQEQEHQATSHAHQGWMPPTACVAQQPLPCAAAAAALGSQPLCPTLLSGPAAQLCRLSLQCCLLYLPLPLQCCLLYLPLPLRCRPARQR